MRLKIPNQCQAIKERVSHLSICSNRKNEKKTAIKCSLCCYLWPCRQQQQQFNTHIDVGEEEEGEGVVGEMGRYNLLYERIVVKSHIHN